MSPAIARSASSRSKCPDRGGWPRRRRTRAGRAHLLAHQHGLIGRGHDIAVLRLHGQGQVVRLREPGQRPQGGAESAQAAAVVLSACQRHMSSGSREPLLSVMTAMPRSPGRRAQEGGSARRSRLPMRRIGMGSVEGAGDGHHVDADRSAAERIRLQERRRAPAGRDGRQAGDREVELGRRDAGLGDRPQAAVDIGPDEGLGEDAELHHQTSGHVVELDPVAGLDRLRQRDHAPHRGHPSSAVAPRGMDPVVAAATRSSICSRKTLASSPIG